MQPDDPVPTDGTVPNDAVRLEQIAKIAQNARTSWFGLLALLVFVGVTLMGHEDTDFFAFGAETELPLVSISVPTVSFFITAPALTAALYVYLHIYLHGLWIALAKCPPRIGEDPLEERVYPTMLCTAALAIRRRLRTETDEPVEGSRAATVVISILMVWLLGPLVLGILWWFSMPYHREWLTLWLALWLWLALIAGGNSLFHLFYLMRRGKLYPYGLFRRPLAHPRPIFSLVLIPVLAVTSWDTTEGGRFVPLVGADLAGTELTRMPAEWLHYDVWLEDWEHRFRLRECPDAVRSGGPCPDEKLAQFRDETPRRWQALIQSLDAPDLGGEDLRAASLSGAFLSGADLRWTKLGGADLNWARLEGAQLFEAKLEGANLREARLEGADLSWATLTGADLRRARLEGADLSWAALEGADLNLARLVGADLRRARLNGASLVRSRLEGANLTWATLEGTDLGEARLEGADLRRARLKGARLDGARLEGANLGWARLEDADLRGARLADAEFGGARLQGADLREASGLTRFQFTFACGDARTRLPDGLAIRTCDD